ncbi:ABC transporter substrate-binding protein [Cognatazoarcus halotolerans]|uniref:ABC transporter substrate-binding protein n=1 Tax=Cognatazoarcus halotolerans TaxID=2686016 RepID=UPI0013589B98|nr:ABC transporter substrate-binding protein [Cognatazoarcus halotolerans]MCB1898194.1 ABC transporter substrate-binding protein [Rhodocyclaceae bacterium]MCP5311723.1 ABC transporter substrate-binding protein [Zoogloeaceae bacterium]
MKTTFKTKLAALALTVAAAPAFADINIGVVFSLTGPAASLGAETKKAIALMPTSLGSEKINYIVLDDGTDPTNAVKNTRKLIGENGVDAIIGPNLITNGVAMADVVNEKSTPMISIAPIDVGADKRKWVYRVEPSAEVMVGRVVADMKKNGVKTVGFIGFSDSWGELLLKALTTTTEAAGIKIVATERFGRTDTSVTAQALKVQMVKPDAVFVGGSGTPAALPQTTLRERGYKGPIYQSHAVANKEFLRLGGKSVEGARLPVAPVLVAEQLPDSHPNKQAGLAFLKKLEAEYGPDSRSTFAGASWDASLLLQNAMSKAIKTAKPGTQGFRDAIRAELEKTSKLVGANGTYTMSATDHGGYDPSAVVLIEVRNGAWKLVD